MVGVAAMGLCLVGRKGDEVVPLRSKYIKNTPFNFFSLSFITKPFIVLYSAFLLFPHPSLAEYLE